MRRTKQALSLLLSLIMVLGMFTAIPFTASAEGVADVYVSTWDDLQDALDNDNYQGKTIGLSASLDGSGEDTLTLNGSGKSMTIDLAGFEIDMKRTSKGDNKHVFEAKGGATLTIKDTVGTGAIKGGWANNGGGIYVNEDSKVILDGVTVSNNKAGTDGGAVYVKGILEMTNSTLMQNSAGDTGGAIYVTTDGSFTLTDSVITQNNATKTGGGINMHLKSDSTISGCQITYNTAGSYGGGIRMDAQDKTLTINRSTSNSTLIDHNTASDDGGGIYLHYGTINMTGGSISNNKSNKDGGGVKVTPRTAFTANGVIINENEARDEEGGGVKNQGTTTLTSCTISKNSTDKQGGGIFNDDYNDSEGDLTLDSCSVTLNTSQSTGGGVYSDKKLKLIGGTFSQNYAGDGKGCSIFIGKDSDDTEIEGELIVDGNSTSSNGHELLLRTGQSLTLSGALTGNAKIGVTMDGGVGTFTSGYNTYHSETEPQDFFYSPDGFDVIKDETSHEAQLATTWPELQDQINRANSGDTITLTHKYTAAASHDRLKIDGDKTLTIDLNGFTLNRNLTAEKTDGHVIEVFSGLTLIIKDSSATENSAGTGKIMGGYSARGGGIYVQNGAVLKIESGTITGNTATVDGGGIFVNGALTMTGGTITDNYAKDTGGGFYVNTTGKFDLKNAKITNNEATNNGGAIRMHLREDSVIDSCTISNNKSSEDIGGGISMDAKDKTLTITDSHIDNNNSADDGAGIYLENGTVVMTRGTVSNNFATGDGAGVKVTKSGTLSATNVTFNGNTSDEEEGGAIKNFGTTTLKSCNIINNEASKQGGGIFNDSTDGSAGNLSVENCTIAGNSASKGGGIYTDGSLTIKGTNTIGAATVNDDSIPANKAKNEGGGIYIDSGAVTTNIQGALTMTGNTASAGGDLYIKSDDKLTLTGKIDGTEIGIVDMGNPGIFTVNYGTVKSGLDDETYPDQTYQVEKGATITIPGNIYKDIQGKYISGWSVTGENTDTTCKPRDSFKVTENLTFTAQWLEEGQIPVRIDWKDGDNTDRLRASSVPFTVTHGDGESTVTLAAKDDWQTVLTVNSNITDIVPNWSARIVTSDAYPYGRDAYAQYRYEKELIEGEGYVFTFYHTPQTRTQLSGTVVWDDEGNESNRPASVTIKLIANGVELNQTVTASADNDWRFTFSDLTEYADGEKVVYTISVDEIDNYMTIIDGYTVTNTYSAYDNSIAEAVGTVFWDDGKNAKGLRPQTVTVRLLNGSNEEVASSTVEPDEDGNWEFSFGAIPLSDTQSYTVTIDAIPEYTFTVENTYSPAFQIFCTLIVDEEEKVPAELEEAPTALNPTYTGEAQTLIEAGKANGGTIMYALGTDENTAPASGYSEELPAATEVGTYYVWYYVDGDALHTDTEKQCLTVNIANHYFMRHSLSLNGDIGVNFYLKLTEAEINSGAEVEFELNGEVISTYTINKTRDANTIDGMTLYKAFFKVCAPEMADTITATLTIGGSDVETDTYSAKQYADVILSSDYEEKFLAKEGNTEDDYAELATLVQTMLNYGAATQEQFVDEHPDNTVMANDDIDYDLVLLKPEELSALDMAVPDKDAINAQLEGTGLTYYGYTMLLHSETKLRFYFQKADPDTDITGIHLSITAGQNTVTYNAQNYNKKYAYVEVPAIPAYELNNVYTLTVGDKNLGSYSALTYVKDVLTDNELASDDPLVATATAIYRYHKAAVIWFSSHSNS